MIFEATLKPLAVAKTSGDVQTIRVMADSKEQAVKEVRFHAPLQGCGNYAITKIEEVK
ncbi:MAG: hypothetical protein RL317_88 [Pseudomonadota bacterium]|jgi:hypothetical protein